jgi:RND family efflux transporter MFP subunit
MTPFQPVARRAARRVRLALLATVATAMLASVTACRGKQAATDAAPPVVLGAADVAAATTAELGATVLVSGALDPADVVRVRAQVAGTLRDLKVDRGAKVSRGQVLALIEAAGVTSQAENAKATVASAEAALAVARQRLDGTKKLLDAGAASQIDLKTSLAGYDAAVAQLAAARAMNASASEAAGRTSIRSPIDGWVSERLAEAGESVKSDDPVLTVVDPRTLELKGQVNATDAVRVRAGQGVTFTLDAQPGRDFHGTVARVDPMASSATRQVGVFARLPNAAGQIVAGQFAHGRIRTGATTKSVVVPLNAVRGDKESYVLVVEGSVVHHRKVVTGVRDDDAGVIAITSGLKAGERVVTAAGIEMADGTRVSASKEP